MPICLHHNDDDGRCSAAIVYNELFSIFVREQCKFIEYRYNGDINLDDITPAFPNDMLVVVDLSLDDDIYSIIEDGVNKGMKVIHIDHHKSTLDYIDRMTPEQDAIFDKVVKFYNTHISASLLTWVYSYMTEVQKNNPNGVEYDFSNEWSHLMIKGVGEGRIPRVVYFIDDYDVWRHTTPDTMKFNLGFSTVADKSPVAEIWQQLLYNRGDILAIKYVEKGSAILEYKENNDEYIRKRGYEKIIDGKRCFIINCVGGSGTFGDVLKDYDFGILFSYDGRDHRWKLSVRSHENSTFDCAKFAEKYGGGGHQHAAGCACEDIKWLTE